MILSNVDIKKAIENKKIIIEPSPEKIQFSSSALDLRLDDEFKEYNMELLKQNGVKVDVDFSNFNFQKFSRAYLKDVPKERDGSIIIKPGAFILAKTLEKITLPLQSEIAARVEGRSSVARLGLVVHLSCPTIHAGFSGKITLEIINHGPTHIRLDPKKDKICQLIFERLSSRPERANLSQFQGQISVTGEKSSD
ncbi:MAG: dCTP deaminase [Spirochaetes bacterium]|nr:MAG: dCTP deaminase [Spirochaetota bacterium]